MSNLIVANTQVLGIPMPADLEQLGSVPIVKIRHSTQEPHTQRQARASGRVQLALYKIG
jgi:hypothetical protein